MNGTDHLELQLYLRPFAPAEVQHRQREIIDRVERIATANGYDVGVVWWSPKVSRPDVVGPFTDSVPTIVEELFDLADRDGFTLAPFIAEHPGTPPDGDDVVVLPMACLVVRDGGGIQGLYPVTLDGESYTIEDGLCALENGESVTNVAAFVASRDSDAPEDDGAVAETNTQADAPDT